MLRIQRTIDAYEAASRGEQAKLDQIGPAKVVAPDEEQVAEAISAISTASNERVKAIAVLLKPFLISLFLEFARSYRSVLPSEARAHATLIIGSYVTTV